MRFLTAYDRATMSVERFNGLKGVCSDSRSRLEAREKYDKVWVLPRAPQMRAETETGTSHKPSSRGRGTPLSN